MCRAATPKYISSAMFTVIVVVCVICIMLAATVQLSTIVFWVGHINSSTSASTTHKHKHNILHTQACTQSKNPILYIYLSYCLCLMCCFDSLVQDTPVFRGSTPSFLSLMLVGAEIGYVAIILANIDIDRTKSMPMLSQLCRAQYWLLGLSFVLMFGTLALKTWRIRKIFCNASLSDLGTRVQTKYLYVKLGVLLAIEMLINIIFNAADPLKGEFQVTDTTYSAVCHSKSGFAYMIVMVVSKGLIAVACVILAYETRNVTSAFNESKQLMIASYNMFVSVIVIVALSTTVPDPAAAKAIFSFGSIFVITSTWVILYAVSHRNNNQIISENHHISSCHVMPCVLYTMFH